MTGFDKAIAAVETRHPVREPTKEGKALGGLLLDSMMATNLLGWHHIEQEAVEAGWQPQAEQQEFSEITDRKMTPEEALDFFFNKLTMIKVPDFVELQEQYRALAFTIAWVDQLDLLESAKAMLEEFIKDDRGLVAFRAELGALFERVGVAPLADWHVETVFRTNMQTAYGAGRWEALQDPEMVEFFPVYEYHAIDDDRHRPTHWAMHGKRFARNDPIWDVWWPVNGYECRCGVLPVSNADPKKTDSPPGFTLDAKGNLIKVVPDDGFAHNPGGRLPDDIARELLEKRGRVL